MANKPGPKPKAEIGQIIECSRCGRPHAKRHRVNVCVRCETLDNVTRKALRREQLREEREAGRQAELAAQDDIGQTGKGWDSLSSMQYLKTLRLRPATL